MTETNSVDTTNPVETLTSTARVVFAISGIITAAVGILLLVWPNQDPQLTLGIFAIYAFSGGVIAFVLGVFGRGLASWRRGGHALVGVLLMVVAIFALSGIDPSRSNTVEILGVVAGIVWIVQGVFSVAETDRSKDTLWSIIFGVVSVMAGIAVLISPLWGTGAVGIFFGIALVVLGLAQLARSQRIGDWTSNPVRGDRAAAVKRPGATTTGRTSAAKEPAASNKTASAKPADTSKSTSTGLAPLTPAEPQSDIPAHLKPDAAAPAPTTQDPSSVDAAHEDEKRNR